MKQLFEKQDGSRVLFPIFLGCFLLAGCTTTPKAPQNPVPAVMPSGQTPPAASEMSMLIESMPPGAIIVVDGRPVGKTPIRINVPATPQGFFLNYVEIRARYVATDENETSHTVTEEFTPLEKVPKTLHFTPSAARRLMR